LGLRNIFGLRKGVAEGELEAMRGFLNLRGLVLGVLGEGGEELN